MRVIRLWHASTLSALALVLSAGVSFGLTVDRILASVNNEAVTMTEYRRFISKSDPAADRETVTDSFLDKLIEEKIIFQEAMESGLTASEDEVSQGIEDFLRESGLSGGELESMLAHEGMTIAEYRMLLKENLISLKLINREVNARVVVTSGDIKRYYEQNLRLFLENPEKVLVKAIFIKLGSAPTLTEITELKLRSLNIAAAIKNGELFDRMLMVHTDKSLRERNGLLGDFERGTLIPALDDVVFKLKEGEVSNPVWTSEGVYILKVDKRTAESYLSMEKNSDVIYAKVLADKQEEKFKQWLKGLWERSSIKIYQR
jgi:parvulin-like peptidyl-prolyl isomerase